MILNQDTKITVLFPLPYSKAISIKANPFKGSECLANPRKVGVELKINVNVKQVIFNLRHCSSRHSRKN